MFKNGKSIICHTIALMCRKVKLNVYNSFPSMSSGNVENNRFVDMNSIDVGMTIHNQLDNNGHMCVK